MGKLIGLFLTNFSIQLNNTIRNTLIESQNELIQLLLSVEKQSYYTII